MHPGDRLKGGLKSAARRFAVTDRRDAEVPVILTFHSVGTRDHEMNVRPDVFAEQMHWLADNASVISLDDAAAGTPGVAVTFDDGYLDNLINAAPVLAQHEIPATVFVVAARTGMILDHDGGDPNARLLTWDQLAALLDAGWTVGGHTMTHPRLSDLSRSEQRHEIQGCKRVIERSLDVEVRAFAYPFGSALDYTPESAALVREAGYRYAVSNRYGICRPIIDRWQMRRIWIDRRDTLESFRDKVEGRLDRFAWMDSAAGIWARRTLNELLRVG